MKRFFMIAYQAYIFDTYSKQQILAIQTYYFSTDDGEIPPKSFMLSELQKEKEIMSRPVIFNIFEFKNEKDYNDFTELSS